MQNALGNGFDVIAEGLVTRTTNLDDPVCPDRNGLKQPPACLESHKPVDLVIIMVGTNDLKARFARSASDIAESAARVAGAARATTCGANLTQPKVVLVCPSSVKEAGAYREMHVGAEAKSNDMAPPYERYSAWVGVIPFDAGAVAAASNADGVPRTVISRKWPRGLSWCSSHQWTSGDAWPAAQTSCRRRMRRRAVDAMAESYLAGNGFACFSPLTPAAATALSSNGGRFE